MLHQIMAMPQHVQGTEPILQQGSPCGAALLNDPNRGFLLEMVVRGFWADSLSLITGPSISEHLLFGTWPCLHRASY